jgi:hypothetical protein
VAPALGFIGAVFFGAAAGASAAYVLAVNLARIALLSLASKLAAPKIDLTQAAQNKMLTVRSTVQPQGYTYGRDMLSGPLIFANTAGSGNNDLHRVVALHGREIDAFEAYRIDDFDIVVGTEIAAETGTVTGGRFADVVDIDVKHGTATQTVISALNSAFPTLWTSGAHRARGWSLLYTKMTLKDGNDAFENGIPQNLRALVRGHKVYDPRLDSTQVIDSSTSPPTTGTGAHRVNDDTTWEWSENPALCLADFLIWQEIGMGEETDRIDWELCATAADICEEQVPVPPCTSPQTSFQDRYTCNFTFFATQNRGEVKEMLETAMLGRTVFSQGKWRMWAGAAITPDVVLTEANLAGAIQMQASSGSQQRYNRVRGKFIDPTRDYSANSYPEIRNASYESTDTEVRYQVFDINTCNDFFEAQRDAIHKSRMSRNQRTLVWNGNWSCFRIQPGSVCQLSVAELGLDTSPPPKYFVTEWSLQKDGSGVALTMVEENDSVWTDPLCSDYVVRSPTGELIFQNQGGDVNLFDADIHNKRLDLPCFSGVELNDDGFVYHYRPAVESGSSPPTPLLRRASVGQWLLNPAGSASGTWYVRATMNTSPAPTLREGTLDTWLDLSVSGGHHWDLLRTQYGKDEANITLEITDRDDFSPAIIAATGIFDLIAEVVSDVRFPDIEAHDTYIWDGSTVNRSATAGVRFNNTEGVDVGSKNGAGTGSVTWVEFAKWWQGPPFPDNSPTTMQAKEFSQANAWTFKDIELDTWFNIRVGALAESYQMSRSWADGYGTESNTSVFGFKDSAISPEIVFDSFTAFVTATLAP